MHVMTPHHANACKTKLLWYIFEAGNYPIFHDATRDFGFIHRLDVPSSGLILAEAGQHLELQGFHHSVLQACSSFAACSRKRCGVLS